ALCRQSRGPEDLSPSRVLRAVGRASSVAELEGGAPETERVQIADTLRPVTPTSRLRLVLADRLTALGADDCRRVQRNWVTLSPQPFHPRQHRTLRKARFLRGRGDDSAKNRDIVSDWKLEES